MTEKYWCATPGHIPWARLDAFIVKPNHVHGIITIGAIVGAINVGAKIVGAKNLLPLLKYRGIHPDQSPAMRI